MVTSVTSVYDGIFLLLFVYLMLKRYSPANKEMCGLMKRYLIACMLVLSLILTGCAEEESTSITAFANLPAGNVTAGERLYFERINGQPKCSDCHSLDGAPNIGPTLQGFGEIAASRVEGQSAGEYTLQSIVRPWTYIVDGFNNIMPNRYTHTMTDQQIADIIAFVLTQ